MFCVFNITIIFICLFYNSLMIINVPRCVWVCANAYRQYIVVFISSRLSILMLKRALNEMRAKQRSRDFKCLSNKRPGTKNGEIDRRQAGLWCSWCLTRRNPLSVIIISGTLSIGRGSSRVKSICLHLSKWGITMGSHISCIKDSMKIQLGTISPRAMYA